MINIDTFHGKTRKIKIIDYLYDATPDVTNYFFMWPVCCNQLGPYNGQITNIVKNPLIPQIHTYNKWAFLNISHFI